MAQIEDYYRRNTATTIGIKAVWSLFCRCPPVSGIQLITPHVVCGVILIAVPPSHTRSRLSKASSCSLEWTPGILPETEIDAFTTLEALLSRTNAQSSPDLTLPYLQHLAREVNRLGGWLIVTGSSLWSSISVPPTRQAQTDYNCIWFPVLKSFEFRQRYSASNPFSLSPDKLHADALVPIPVLTPPSEGCLTPAFWSSLFSSEIALLRGFTPDVWPLDHSLFTAECVAKQHSQQSITVMVEEGWPESGRIRAVDTLETTVGEYVEKAFLREGSPRQVAADVDISQWAEQVAELRRRLPRCLLFDSSDDMLRYTRLHVSTITLPLLDIRPSGSWRGIGGPETALSRIQVNHGPGTCVQWALGMESAERFEWDMKKRGHGEVSDGEGTCWPDENYLMSEGLRTYIGFQEPGDILYLGPSTYHWSRSLTPAVHSSWRLLPASVPHFSSLFSAVSMPLQPHTLALDLLNHSLASLPVPLVSYLSTVLQSRFQFETAAAVKSKLRSLGVFPGHQVVHCEKCSTELFYCYTSCNQCETAMCVHCGRKHRHKIYGYCSLFRIEEFERLEKRIEQRCAGGDEDLYDPGLNRQFSRKDRERELKLWRGPFTGVPNCIYYRKKETGEAREKPSTTMEVREEPEVVATVNQPGDNEYVIPKKQRRMRHAEIG